MNLPFNLKQFFSLSRLLDWRPTISKEAIIIFSVIFLILLIVAVVLKIKEKKLIGIEKKLSNRYFNLFLTVSLLGFFWTFCRYEKVLYLSARIWLWALILTFLIWLGFIFKYQFKVVPAAKKRLEQKQIFERYLPKKK